MTRPQPHRVPRRHFSTMPRVRSEANTYLDLYKLQLEKQRIHCKLRGMEQQTIQIQQRLAQIESEMGTLQSEVQQGQASTASGSVTAARPASANASHPAKPAGNPVRSTQPLPQAPDNPSTFKTLFVEY
ncbi:MAG: hypothetical protein ACO4AI_05820 [Prochlorothrix sp.]|nr:hypothetical protein [Prochlorothrix sp.]